MRLLFILVVSFFSVLAISSCQKEIDFDATNPTNPNPPAGATGNMKAKFNGTQWIANKGAGASRMGGLINITGFSTDRKYLTITLADSGVHRYILSDATINVAAYIDSNDANQFALTSNQGVFPTTSGGEVTITSIDTAKKTISGTFSFKLYRDVDNAAKTVTEGSFTNLTYSTSLPPSAATDTFKVKIDGTLYTPPTVVSSRLSMFSQITVTGTNGTKAVGLVFPDNITPGSYTLDLLGATYTALYNPDADPLKAKGAVSGTLTILEHNTGTKRIRGNFNFRGEELLNPANFALLTEGYFSVKYN